MDSEVTIGVVEEEGMAEEVGMDVADVTVVKGGLQKLSKIGSTNVSWRSSSKLSATKL